MNNSKAFHDAFIKMIDFAKEHLTKEQFNEFLYTMYTCGIENVSIIEIPVYENVEYNGCVLWKRIKGVEYKIECNRMDTQEEMNIQEDIPEHDKKMADAFYEMVVKPLKEQLEKN